MIDGAFLQGTLELPQSLPEMLSTAPMWIENPLNRILCIVSVLLILATISESMNLLPLLLDACTRWRGSVSLQHSVGAAQARNIQTAVFSLPFTLMLSRYSVISTGLLATAIAMVLYFAARALLHSLIKTPKMNSDEGHAVHTTLFNFFILNSILCFILLAILRLFEVPDQAIRIAIIAQTALLWVVSLIRSGQILSTLLPGLSTILYLCGLELLPAVALLLYAALM